MKRVLLSKFPEESPYVPLISEDKIIGAVHSDNKSMNSIWRYDVDLSDFFNCVITENNFISKDFAKELLALINSEHLHINFFTCVAEACMLLDENITFPLTRDSLENLLSAYCDVYESPYERFLEIVLSPNLLKNQSNLNSTAFSNSFNLYKSYDKKDTFAEFTINPEDIPEVNNKVTVARTLEEMNREVLKKKDGNQLEATNRTTEPEVSEENGFSNKEVKEGDDAVPVDTISGGDVLENTEEEKHNITIPEMTERVDEMNKQGFGNEEENMNIRETLKQQTIAFDTETTTASAPVAVTVTTNGTPVATTVTVTEVAKPSLIIGEELISEEPVGVGVVEPSIIVGEELVGEELVGEELIGEELIGEELIGEELIGEELIGEEPVGEESVGEESVGEELISEEPIGEESTTPSLPEQQNTSAQALMDLVSEGVGEQVSQQTHTVEVQPNMSETSLEELFTTRQDIENGDSQLTPIEGTPIEETPVEGAPVEGAPVQETPVQETPVEGAPVQETPVEETPMQGLPVEEPPVQEMPIEGTPIAESPIQSMEGASSLLSSSQQGTKIIGKNESVLEKTKDGVQATIGVTPEPSLPIKVQMATSAREQEGPVGKSNADNIDEPNDNTAPMGFTLTPEEAQHLLPEQKNVGDDDKDGDKDSGKDDDKDSDLLKKVLKSNRQLQNEKDTLIKKYNELKKDFEVQKQSQESLELVEENLKLVNKVTSLESQLKEYDSKIKGIESRYEVDYFRQRERLENSFAEERKHLDSVIEGLKEKNKLLENKTTSSSIQALSSKLAELTEAHELETQDLRERIRELETERDNLLSEISKYKVVESTKKIKEYTPTRTVADMRRYEETTKNIINVSTKGNVSVEEFYNIKDSGNQIPKHGVSGLIIKPTKG